MLKGNFFVNITLFLIIHYFKDQICITNVHFISNLLKTIILFLPERKSALQIFFIFLNYTPLIIPRISPVLGLHEPWKKILDPRCLSMSCTSHLQSDRGEVSHNHQEQLERSRRISPHVLIRIA